MLPDKHKDEWHTIDGLDSMFLDMALYHTDTDAFYNVIGKPRDSVMLENGETGIRIIAKSEHINEQLYDEWLPVEVIP